MSDNLKSRQQTQLSQGIAQLGLSLSAARQELLLGYLQLLQKWNKAYNLTAIRDPDEHVSRHVLDALAILPFLRGKHFLDVGTGPGIPGMLLAIANPDSHWVLLDSNGKKTRFLTQCKMALGLSNIDVVQSRIEQYRPSLAQPFEGITSRAFATLQDMVLGCEALFGSETLAYAMKGVHPVEEIEALPDTYKVIDNHKLSVPFCDAERHLVVIGRQQAQEPEGRQ